MADNNSAYTLQQHPDIKVHFFKKIDDAISRWEKLTPNDTFFGYDFLKALEVSPPSDSKFRYAIFSDADDNDIGIAYFQIKTIRLDESLRFDVPADASTSSKVIASVKRSVAAKFRAYTLVVGNLTLTGNYGMHFISDIAPHIKFDLVEDALDILLPILRNDGIKVRGIMYKDYNVQHRMSSDSRYTEFSVQPTMSVDIPATWTNTDDYIAAMKSKYKVRMRRARTKAEDITKRVLSVDEIKYYEKDIARLYRYVSDQAGFNLFLLKDDYFCQLARHLGDDYKLTAYFIKDKMVGFFTSIKSGRSLDAHFLGYDNDYNAECQLYLNMLYDLVEEGIAQGVDHVDLSRTALEIKSSVGAVPTDLYLYLRLVNKRLDKYTPRLLDFLTPKEEWKPRNPFKV